VRILALGAHFDDVELGCGGALLKHRDRGDEIFIVVVTHSGYQSGNKGISRRPEDARKEGEDSAAILGAELTALGKEPIVMVPTEKLVLEIEEVVNRIKPDRVFTHRPNDCHADHAAVGYVSMRACRKCDEILLYRSNWYIMNDSTEDNFYIDISSQMDEKIRLIHCFRSEMENVNYTWVDFVKKQNGAAGARVGTEYAETFSIMKMLWR